eukprot:1560208-Amphidinium_carterae.1
MRNLVKGCHICASMAYNGVWWGLSGGKQGGTPEDAATEALKSAQSAYNTAKDSAVKQLDNLAAYHKHVELAHHAG